MSRPVDRNAPSGPEIKEQILARARWLYILFLGVGALVIGRILYIQYGPDGPGLREKAVDRRSYREQAIEAKRGDILSHDYKVLATSIPTYELRMDFNVAGLTDEVFFRDVDSLALCLSSFFGDKSPAEYRRVLTEGRRHPERNRYVRLAPRRIDYLELQEVSRFPIFRLGRNKGGFIPVAVNRRVRPNGHLASRTVGSVNLTGAKVGIEGAFDPVLRGKDGSTLMQKISGNFWIPVHSKLSVEPVDGIDVVSTLDIELQDVAEKALREQLEGAGAIWGTVVVMEVATGEVRAIANLHQQPSGEYLEDYNYAIGMSMEPGSTFKLVTLMALLDDAKADINEMVATGSGEATIAGTRVRDSHADGYGTIPLKRVFEVSSNIGFAREVNKYYGGRPKRFVDYIYGLGLQKPLGLQLKGEAPPVIRRPGDKLWNGTTLTMMSFGYALMISPIHTLTLYNAIANDGKMVKPVFVKELRQNGRTLMRFGTEVIHPRICSPSTLRFVRESLEGVVNEGTARLQLKNPYYTVAGKTGTAQVAKGRYGYNVNGGKYYLGTLVGYFPADRPRYSCIVAIETFYRPGSGKLYYGGSLAGPVFRAIADKMYAQSADWRRDRTLRQNRSAVREETPASSVALKGGNAAAVAELLDTFGLVCPGGFEARRGRWVTVDTLNVLRRIEPRKGTIPDVRGMGLRDAVHLVESSGLHLSFSGKGRVVSQTPVPGTPAVPGDTVAVSLAWR